jgi:hypothetical protein
MQKIKNPFFFFVLSLILILFPLHSSALDLSKVKGIIDNNVIRLLKTLPSEEFYSDASVIVILDEKIDEIRTNRSSRSTMHTIFKVINEKGIGYANVEIGYNSRRETISIEFARTITPEGKIIPLHDDAIQILSPYKRYSSYDDYKVLTFVLPEVVVGSIIDYKVVIDEKYPNIEGEYSSKFYFQKYEPTLLSRFKIITPEDLDLRYSMRNPLADVSLDPNISHNSGKNVFLWEYRNIPHIIYESNMPPISEIAFNIWVTTIHSWDDFFSWWNKLKHDKTQPNDSIRKKVVDLTRGRKTLQEKAASLFYYVEKEIESISISLEKSGYEPAQASTVFERKYGDGKDKSTLLISMLKASDIPAYYVWISTHGFGRLIKDFPYPFQFNHCIVAIEGKEGYHFLDPTPETYPFNYLPSDKQDCEVLLFKDQGGIFTRTPLSSHQENGVFHKHTIIIDPDGSIEVEKKSLSFGDVGASNRATYLHCDPTELKELFERAISTILPGATLISYSISDPLDFEKPFIETYRFLATSYCKKTDNFLIFQLPGLLYDYLSPGKERRKYPLNFPSVHALSNDVEIILPEEYKVYYLPKPIKIRTPYVDFQSSYRLEEGKIIYQGEKFRKITSIPPEGFLLYWTFCQFMNRRVHEWIILEKRKGF